MGTATAKRAAFATTSRRKEQHLLWAGVLLDQSASRHQPLTQDLFLAAGAGDDIAEGDITLLAPAASPTRGHSLLPYRTAHSGGALTRIFAIGRNTHGQLGLGFASQEATFGLVRPGFNGAGGIQAVLAAQSQTWITTSDTTSHTADPDDDAAADTVYKQGAAFATGNNTLGQLGIPWAPQNPASSSPAPTMKLMPAPCPVTFAPTANLIGIKPEDQEQQQPHWNVLSVAAGLDHCLILRHCRDEDDGSQLLQICSTGLNTDGQLGRALYDDPHSSGHPRTFSGEFAPVLERTYTATESLPDWHIAAGGDTSFAWVQDPATQVTQVWAWGNNEYSQCLVSPGQGQAADQVTTPTEITDAVLDVIGHERSIAQVAIGGSWVAILDDQGRLFTAGLGAIGRSQLDEDGPSALLQLPELPPLSTISASNDSIAAISGCQRKAYVWGIDASRGVLGLNTWPSSDSQDQNTWTDNDVLRRVEVPEAIDLTSWLGANGHVEAVALGGEQSWILVEDNLEPVGVWRGSQRLDVALK
ncbi:unnamed protein product [Sympodiomycopsis kandeliae]